MEENYSTENTGIDSSTEISGSMTFDGEAWKNRENITYTSILDIYNASDLFSSKSMEFYHESEQEKLVKQQEMVDYIFSDQLNTENSDEELINYIFSEEIELSKVKKYSRNENNYFICYILAIVLTVLVFVYLIMNFILRRKKRRGKYATEINMED